MNLKEENKLLRREVFELKFKIDMDDWKSKNEFQYNNIVHNIDKSLIDVSNYDTANLSPMIEKYSYETIQSYFLKKRDEWLAENSGKVFADGDKVADTGKVADTDSKEVIKND
jgi:hypothetical protein